MTSSISPDLSIIVLDNVPWTAANWNVPRTVADQTRFIKYVLFFSLAFDSVRSSAPLRDEEAVLQHLNELISQLAGLAAGRQWGKGLAWTSENEKRLVGGPDVSTSRSNPVGKLSEGGEVWTGRTSVLMSCW